MGYKEYEGLGARLDDCKSVSAGPLKPTDEVIELLRGYLDAWDAAAASDAVETELVGLFDSSMRVSETSLPVSSSAVSTADNAADTMSVFFEFAAQEKSRLANLTGRFLPNYRNSRKAFAERFCWARHMEQYPVEAAEAWERCVTDGNRDIRSRLPTVPCSPQFRRFIPKYLDNTSRTDDYGSPGGTGHEMSPDEHRRSSTATATDMDEITKNLLKAGNLEIVDITKKEVEEEDGLDVTMQARQQLDGDDDFFSDSNIDPVTLDESSKEDTKPPKDDAADTENDKGDNVEGGDDDSLDGADSFPLEDTAKGSHHNVSASAFSTPPDNASSSLSLMSTTASSMIEMHLDNCLHVKPEGSRQCTMLLTGTHLILEYDGDTEGFFEGELLATQEEADRQRMMEDAGYTADDNDMTASEREMQKRIKDIAALRPKSIRWNLSEVSHVYLRRYRLRDSSIEIFFIPSGGTSFGGYGQFAPTSSLFLDFGTGAEGKTRRDDTAFAVMRRSPAQAIKQWPDRSDQFLHDQLSRLTMGTSLHRRYVCMCEASISPCV